ncbi:MAG: hypothetical protein ACI9FG_001949 [Crocinitomicaceae bacterium]|jgi:hypothetical protein
MFIKYLLFILSAKFGLSGIVILLSSFFSNDSNISPAVTVGGFFSIVVSVVLFILATKYGSKSHDELVGKLAGMGEIEFRIFLQNNLCKSFSIKGTSGNSRCRCVSY